MKASPQFQKKSAAPVTPIPLTTNLFRAQRSPAPATEAIAPATESASLNSEALSRITPDWNRIFSNSSRPATVQPKLTVGAPNDVYEQEADRVADQVMSMPESASVQREMAPEEEEIQTKPLAATITPLVQREAMPEEEEVQTKPSGDIQREEMPQEEEDLQMKALAQPLDQRIAPTLQREEMPEEEEVQTKPLANTLQREAMPEEEEALQTKALPTPHPLLPTPSLQREATPEEEEIQTKPLANTLQRQEMPEEEEAVQTKPSLQRATDGSLQAGGNLESRLNSSKGGGNPLPQDVKGFMESRFRTDFSQVRVHTDSEAVQMNRDLNAQAFTHKQDVYFGGGKAPGKDALTAHELTHVVQQSTEAQTKVERTVTEKKPVVNKFAPVSIAGGWLSDAKNALSDFLNIRDNEAELDQWEDAVKAMRKFSSNIHTTKNFQSTTTRLGMFDATYQPQSNALSIVCKCKFNFINGSGIKFPNAYPGELKWNDQEEKDKWKAKFIQIASSSWSSKELTFYCHKDWWEALKAKVSVQFQEVDSGEHFALNITKAPVRFNSITSKVKAPEKGILFDTPGEGNLDSRDLEETPKKGGTQVPAVHESGHMLGLDDEYKDKVKSGEAKHNDLVKSEFGHGVALGSDGRIMSGGMDIQPEHGVTFLAALKKATGMDEWHTTPKEPRPVPQSHKPSGGPAPAPGATPRTPTPPIN